MKDIVERLRDYYHPVPNPLRDEAAAEIARLRDENESLRGSLEEWKLDFASLRTAREASEAREAQLREALSEHAVAVDDEQPKTFACHHASETCPSCEWLVNQWKKRRRTIAALDLPTDDTALKARLKAERERCAKVCEVEHPHTFARLVGEYISNLGD